MLLCCSPGQVFPRVRCLVLVLTGAILTLPASGLEPDEQFNRIQLRVEGVYSQPDPSVDGVGLDLGASGFWTLAPGVVAELGVGRQQEWYEYGQGQEIDLVMQYGYFGARGVLPMTSPLRLSAAARGYRGRLGVSDELQWRSIRYHWLEAGVHYSAPGTAEALSATLRQYRWADSTEELRVVGEWLLGGAPWGWGLSLEYSLEADYLQGGISLNHRF